MDDKKKTILIVTEVQGYLMLSLKEKFEEAEYHVINVKPDMNEINKINEDIKAILLYGNEDLAGEKAAMIYIKDRAAEEDIPLFATGSKDELDMIEQVIGSQLIRQKFVRPINVKDLVDAIENYIEKFGGENKKKILVVDDSGAVLRNVKAWLEDHYQVILANSGAMAIKYLATNRPDLVLLDYEMPVVDGKQVLEMIRSEKEFEDIPVIFLTSKGDKESVMKVMALKPEGYLLKTQEPSLIIKAIDEFFEKQKAINR